MSKNIVIVTWHAVAQFIERFPNESAAEPSVRLFIAQEVEDALEHYRYSTKQPKWARSNGHRSRGRRNRHELDRTLRFVWTKDQRRMYLIDKRGSEIKVITSIDPEGTRNET